MFWQSKTAVSRWEDRRFCPCGRRGVRLRGADLDERVRKRAGVFGRAGERNVGKESESFNLLVEGFVPLVRAGGLVDARIGHDDADACGAKGIARVRLVPENEQGAVALSDSAFRSSGAPAKLQERPAALSLRRRPSSGRPRA